MRIERNEHEPVGEVRDRRSRGRSFVPAILCAFALGLILQPAARAVASSTTYEKLGIFTRVLSYVQNNYVEEVDSTALIYGAIKGMLSTLDAHSTFMTPAEYEEMKIDTGGEFGGIGLEVGHHDGRVVVVSPLDDTPAAHAGLRSGDVIVAIDGVEIGELALAEAVRLMRGSPGTIVVLTIDRRGFNEPREIPIRREHIQVNPVSARLVEGYVLVRIKVFQDRTDRYLQRALGEMKTASGGDIKGMVLDLRNNPGGLLDQAVAISDLWLEEGVIVTTRGRGAHEEIQRAHRRGTEPAYPMVVLINEGSASASEIVAGALQDHGRAVLMGTRTFGKGSVQTVIDLEDGSGLKLTIARYFTPNGTAIGEGGISPDVVIDLPPPAPGPPAVEEEALGEPELDRQLRTAIDSLRTWYIFKSTERAPAGRAAAAR